MGGNYTKYEILHLTSILCGLPGLRGTTRAEAAGEGARVSADTLLVPES